MKHLIFTEHSECCGAPIKLDTSKEPTENKEVFLFICSKCKKQCHLQKKTK